MNTTFTKKDLQQLVEDNKEELICLCSELVKIPSINPPADMSDIYSYISRYLGKANIETKQVGPRIQRQSLIAQVGNEGRTFVFNGHADVVPTGIDERWNTPPFSGMITETQILGRGATDMKGGLSAALFVFKLLAPYLKQVPGILLFHVVPDEETGGAEGSKWLVENGYAQNAGAVLVAEPTSPTNCEVGQKSSVATTIETFGVAAHGSLGGYAGNNAIGDMMRILPKVQELERLCGTFAPHQQQVLAVSKEIAKRVYHKRDGVENIIDHVTVNVGTIQGGSKRNIVADYCVATVDIRVPIGLGNERIVSEINNIFKDLQLSQEQAKVTCHWNAEANFTEESAEIVQLCSKNAQDVFRVACVPAYQWPSSDSRYYRAAGIPTIQFGPSNSEGIHSYNESVNIEDLINTAKVYMGILYDYFVENA